MKSLQDFPVLGENEISLCEIDGRMQICDINTANLSNFTSLFDKYPKICVTNDARQYEDTNRPLFLPVEVPFLKHLTQVYYEQGFKEVLQILANDRRIVISNTAGAVLRFIDYFNKIRHIFNPNLSLNCLDILNEFTQTRKYNASSIKCLAWNLYLPKLAVGTTDDVRIYTDSMQSYQLLRSKYQKNISCLAWRPLSPNQIAVGHENGVTVWRMDGGTLSTSIRPSAVGNAQILYCTNRQPVLSLVWGVRGDYLITATASQPTLYVWNVDLQEKVVLKSSSDNGNVLLKISPNGERLFNSTVGVSFPIWNCRQWEYEKWKVITGRVQSACWTNCGKHLLFATNREPIIYGLTVDSETVFVKGEDKTTNQALPLYDLSKVDIGGVVVGGVIRMMESDSKMDILAVIFEDSNFIATFNIIKKPKLQLVANSLIKNYSGEFSSCLAFQCDLKNGTCLTVGWSSGRVQYYPMIFSDTSANETDQTQNQSTYKSF